MVCVCLWWTYRRTLDADKKDHSFTAMFASEGRQRNGVPERDKMGCTVSVPLNFI